MVNFYNDYVTCSKTANLSDVAGESSPYNKYALTHTYNNKIISKWFMHFLPWHADHFDYIKKVAGASIIGFGGDYDGVGR